MANPLFETYGRKNNNSFMQAFEQFRRSFKGDARAEVERLMKSGQMSQQQFDELTQQANQIIQMFKF